MRYWVLLCLLPCFLSAVTAEDKAETWFLDEYGTLGEHWSAFGVLATSTSSGELHTRTMGFDTLTTFYTSSQSRKGQDLSEHPYAAVTIYLPKTKRQISYHGPVEKISGEEYWSRYPLRSRQIFTERLDDPDPDMPTDFVGYKVHPSAVLFFEIPASGIPQETVLEPVQPAK